MDQSRRQRQVPPPPHDQPGPGQHGRRLGPEAAILPDPDHRNLKVLILGGTTEASALATALAGDPRYAPILSLAGRTRTPMLPAIPARRGGFGGAAGLAAYLRDNAIDALIDATHPFARIMKANAAAATTTTGTPRLALWRPGWTPGPDDRWTPVPDMPAAAAALGPTPRRVFLTIGQQELAPFRAAPWHHYLVRSIEPPDPATLPPHTRCIAARGPFDAAAEHRLLVDERIDILVTKDSGGAATAPKLAAARDLGLPVIVVARPPAPPGPHAPDAPAALAWLAQRAHRGV